MSKVTFEINGKSVQAEQGQMIIEVADENNIRIPRFCYHKKLSIAANCRMCLVQVEKAPKPMPACATPITEGMKVLTRSPMALEAQRIVMEFLLINHPLDCPVCDQGGECELQDVSMGYGEGISEYTEGKRSVEDPDLGPLVATYMTRCIHCTRCIRFGDEISGIRELGAVDRGEFTKITTYVKKNVDSELSGNVIDICPVGALTDKPFQFKARPWELRQRAVIGPHDCVGSHMYLHERRNEVMRAVPKECEAVNEVWISDRDRYGHLGAAAADRLTVPEIKVDGKWKVVDWATALEHTVTLLQTVLHEEGGASNIGALVSSSETIENMHAFQAWLRGLGVDNIDHRLKAQDFSDQAAFPLYPELGMPIAELETADVIMLVGSHLRKEQPLLWHRVHKASKNGAKIIVADVINNDMNLPVAARFIADRGDLLAALTQAVSETKAILTSGKKIAILLGAQALHHPHAAHIRHVAHTLSTEYQATLGLLTEGANSAGAWLAGCVPHRIPGGAAANVGMHSKEMFQHHRKGYVFLNVEPPLDCAYGAMVKKALRAAQAVVCMTTHASANMRDWAHVLLPATPFSEMSGTFVNVQGDWQYFQAAVLPKGQARPAWKICTALAELCRLENMHFETLETVQDDLKKYATTETKKAAAWVKPAHAVVPLQGYVRVAETPIYNVDMLTRRSESLQATNDALAVQGVHVSSALFASLGLKEGEVVRVVQEEGEAYLPLVLNPRLPEHSVFVAYGLPEQAKLGSGFAAISVGNDS